MIELEELENIEVELDNTVISMDYNTAKNKPKINGVELSGNKTLQDLGIIIPTQLSDLNEDSTHRTVSDTEKQTWNNKSDFSGNYNDLTNKPTIPTVPTNVSAFTNDAGYLTEHQDLSNYVQKSQTTGLIKNDGTIDTNTYLTQHQDISGKEDKTNKVTTMSESSTDTEYPSAKCVYEAIQQGGGSGSPEIAITNGTEPTGDEVLWVDESETPEGYQEIYSTTEQKIGKWIDGKDLYRIVIKYTGAISSNTLTQIGTIGHAVDKVVAIDTVLSNSAQDEFFASDYVANSSLKLFSVRVRLSDGVVRAYSLNESWSSPIVYCIIKYTIPNN